MAAGLSYAAMVAHPDDDAYGMAGTVAPIGVIVDFPARRRPDRRRTAAASEPAPVMSDDPDDTDRWKRVVSREWAVIAWPERTTSTQ